ncbi:MAG: hypothetical protein ACI8P3_002671 [Saprospiraceae bacterium]|jgi:hypothetical protein
MRLLALFVLTCLFFSFGCKKEEPPIFSRAPLPGIIAGRPDVAEDKYFIKRYVGFLGDSDSIPLDLLIVNWGNGRLSGHTYYPNHFGVLKFEGRLEEDGSFELVEERFKERNASFVGKFQSTDSMSGTWWNIDSTTTRSFGYKEYISPFDYDHWTGAWHLNDPWDTATLIIGGVTERKLQFAMNIYINGYQEEFYGTADIRGTRAVMDLEFFKIYHENCRVVFHRRGRAVYLEQESFPFLCGLGPNCWTTGVYEDLYVGKVARMDFIGPDSVFADTATFLAFLDLVGPDNLNKFAYNMERLEQHKARYKNRKVYGTLWKGRVRGFHREKEGIIVYDTFNNIWAATTTPPDFSMGPMKVHYFTNVKESKRKMPFAIRDWMSKFLNCTVVYESQ